MLFVLIVANTLVFGLIQKEMAAVVDKGTEAKLIIVEKNETQNSTSSIGTQVGQTTNTAPVEQKQVTPAPVVTHTRRTRAS